MAFSKITLGIVASLALATTCAASYRIAATDNLADCADALIDNPTSNSIALVDAKRTRAVWYERGTIFAAMGVVACWILLAASRSRDKALGVDGAPAWDGAGQSVAPASQSIFRLSLALKNGGQRRVRGDAPARCHAIDTKCLREAMTAQLAAERLQVAAHRINAVAVHLWQLPAVNGLAARVNDEAHDVAALAAQFAGLSWHGGDRRTIVDVAACVDEVVVDTDFRGVPVSWRSASGAPSARAGDRAPMKVFAVATAVRLMLANLLENAVRAVGLAAREGSASQGRVSISCVAENDRVVVTVMDNGVGMSPEQRERAFLPFCSGWPSAAPNSTKGVGLAITARLVGAYGGTIALGSLPQGGTVAQIKLPVAQQRVDEVPAQPSAPASGSAQGVAAAGRTSSEARSASA